MVDVSAPIAAYCALGCRAAMGAVKAQGETVNCPHCAQMLRALEWISWTCDITSGLQTLGEKVDTVEHREKSANAFAVRGFAHLKDIADAAIREAKGKQ